MATVTVTHRVTDVSQVKFHAQDDGICVSVKDGEWIWMAHEVAFYLSSSLGLTTGPCVSAEEMDMDEREYEITYQMLDSVESHTVTVKAISEADALAVFYDLQLPKTLRSNIGRVEIHEK